MPEKGLQVNSHSTQNTVIDAIMHPPRTLVMGVLNITEDSFSDGGRYLDQEQAFAHAQQMIEDGADIIDIGAESTRPGAIRVPEEVERERIVTAVRRLHDEFPSIALSVDTTRAVVAQAALEAGAHIINDVSGGQLDPDIPALVAEYDCLYVVQHWRAWLGSGTGASGQNDTQADRDTSIYTNGVVEDTLHELNEQIEAVRASGVPAERIICDPGLGFSKPTIEHNLPLIMATSRFTHLGYPVLIGASRKRFVGAMNASAGLNIDSESDRDNMTEALTVLAAERGAWAVRVHDVRRNRAAVEAVALAEKMTYSAGRHAQQRQE